MSAQSLNNLIKETDSRTFEEIDNKFNNESEFNFVLFCLNKYPPLGYKKKSDEELKKEYDDDKKKFLRKLSANYLPDRYSDNTNEERRNRLIMEEIYKKMSNLEDIFENRCGTYSTPSQI